MIESLERLKKTQEISLSRFSKIARDVGAIRVYEIPTEINGSYSKASANAIRYQDHD